MECARPALVFSLPRNDPDLATAALDAGADALKVHIHALHQASGTAFGPLAAERPALERIRAATDRPIGVVVGDRSGMATPGELAELAAMGFDFIDAYTRHMPAWMLSVPGVEKMGALAAEDTPVDWAAFGRVFDCVEAAVVEHDRYGAPMNAHDVARYATICCAVGVPVVIPTQLTIRPDDVSLLATAGMSALMIGAIVTGKEPASVAVACEAYHAACAGARGQ